MSVLDNGDDELVIQVQWESSVAWIWYYIQSACCVEQSKRPHGDLFQHTAGPPLLEEWWVKCTGTFLYICYSFLLISNKFCDLSLLHWPRGEGMEGGSVVRKIYGTVLTLLHCGPWNHPWELMYIKLPMDLWFIRARTKCLGKCEGIGPWKSRLFWAQNGTCLIARCHFTGPKKSIDF
jgi:hypothetical protein